MAGGAGHVPRSAGRAAGRAAGWAVALLAAGYVCKWADAQVISVVLPEIRAEFRLSDTALGLLAGLPFAIFYTAMGVPLARLADRRSRRDLVAASLAIFSVATALAAAATSYAWLFASRIGVGIGEAGATPAAQSMIVDMVDPRRRGIALSVYGAGLNVGVLVGFVVGGIVGEHDGWRAACLVVGLPGLAVAALTWLLLREPPRRGSTRAAPTRATLREVLALLANEPAFRRVVAGTSLASLAGYAALTWLPTFLLRDHGMAAAASGRFLGLMSGLVGGAGVLVVGWLGDRVSLRDPRGRPWLLAGATLLVFPFLVAFYADPGRALPVWLFVPPALLGAATAGPAAVIVQEIVPDAMRATALSIMLFVLNLAATTLGPILAGIASDALRPRLGDESLRWALVATAFVLPLAAWQFAAAAAALPDAIARNGGAPRQGAAG